MVKKRVAINGKGKRGGARTIVATKKEDRWFFVYGFNKNDQANISTKELAALTELANLLLNRSDNELDEAVAQNELVEICHD
uniref:type II toxin-antitoxin system RelE/ParE family toxin n=1 Tax=Orrella sp. TaxID=1921583 RepID=UPI0040483229